jgi:hypothetical protein
VMGGPLTLSACALPCLLAGLPSGGRMQSGSNRFLHTMQAAESGTCTPMASLRRPGLIVRCLRTANVVSPVASADHYLSTLWVDMMIPRETDMVER